MFQPHRSSYTKSRIFDPVQISTDLTVLAWQYFSNFQHKHRTSELALVYLRFGLLGIYNLILGDYI